MDIRSALMHPVRPSASIKPGFSGQLQAPKHDSFVRFGNEAAVAAAAITNPAIESLVGIFRKHGMAEATRNAVAITVPKVFSDDGKDQTLTYGSIYDNIRLMGGALQKIGIQAGDRVAMAEFNTSEFLYNYFGGLAVGAEMIPLNLLALDDDRTKSGVLMHMLGGSKLFLVGADPMTPEEKAKQKGLPMLANLGASLQKISVMRHPVLSPILGPMITRFVELKNPKIPVVEKLFRKALAKSAKTDQQRADMGTIFSKLPKGIRIMTPAQAVNIKRSATPLSDTPNHMGKFVISKPKADATADILYTSGTSGLPKGVNLTHKSLTFTVNSMSALVSKILRPEDKTLMALPLFHIFGKSMFLTLLAMKSPMIMVPSLASALRNIPKVIDVVDEQKITVLPAVPKFHKALADYLEKHPDQAPRVQSLRVIISGGEALLKETYDTLKKHIPHLEIYEGYGSSEAGINTLNIAGTQGSIGAELPGVKLNLIDQDESGAGEIEIVSEGVADGYIAGTASEEDQEKFDRKRGAYRTGDIAVRLPDGTLKIVGRNNDVIKIAGEKRDPNDLENALKLTGLVTDTMVVSYKRPDLAERPAALVVTDKAGVTEASIKEALSGLLGEKKIVGWMIPKHIVVLNRNELPKGCVTPLKRKRAGVRDFFKQAIAKNLVSFNDKAEKPVTTVDTAGLEAFYEGYSFGSK